MGFPGKAIFGWARLLAPIILSKIPQTAAIAGDVGTVMDEAEAVHSDPGSGAAKLQHVVNAIPAFADAVNNQTGHDTVDAAAAQAAAVSAINTAFSVAKVVASAHGAPVGTP